MSINQRIRRIGTTTTTTTTKTLGATTTSTSCRIRRICLVSVHSYHTTRPTLLSLPSPSSSKPSTSSSSSSSKVDQLIEKILDLDLIEVHWLTELVQERMAPFLPNANMTTTMNNNNDSGENDDNNDNATTTTTTALSIRLVSFNAKSKIKVIKEVRALTGLGLKEAKQTVEDAPQTILTDITNQEQANEIQQQLLEAGATEVEIV